MLKKLWKNRKNRKGFTLVELIVVVAILGILAAIAIPNLSGIKDRQAITADASTAATIVRAARIQYTETGTKPGKLDDITDDYLKGAAAITPQSGGKFALDTTDPEKYLITWEPTKGKNTNKQTFTEGKTFTVNGTAAAEEDE